MYGNTGTIWAEMGLKYDSLQRGFRQVRSEIKTNERRIDGMLNRMGNKMNNLGSKMVGIGSKLSMTITAPFAAAGAAMSKFAMEGEETQSRFDIVFGELSDQANQWAGNFSNSVGRADQDIKALMASLQDTFVPLDFTRKQSMKLSQSLSKLAVDAASFYPEIKSGKKAAKRFTSALVGNHEAVRVMGVQLTESRIKQEAYNSGLAKQGEELSEQQKMLARYRLIIKGTRDAQGNATETQDEFDNVLRRVWGTLKATADMYGDILIPYLKAFLLQINKFLKWLQRLTPNAKKLLLVLGGIATALGPLITLIGGLIKAFGAVSTAASTVIAWLGEGAGLAGVITSLANPITGVIAAVVALAAAWKTNFFNIRNITKEVVGMMADQLAGLWKMLKGDWKKGWEQLKKASKEGADGIKQATATGFEDIVKKVKDKLADLGIGVKEGAEQAKPEAKIAGGDLSLEFLDEMAEKLKTEGPGKIGDAAGSAFDEAMGALDYAVDMDMTDKQGQIKALKEIRDTYAETMEQRRQIDVKIHRLEKELARERKREEEKQAREEEQRAKEKARQQQKIAENRYKFLRKIGKIDLEEHRRILKQKLSETEKYSDEWMKLQEKIAQARLESLQKQAEMNDWSTEEQIKNIRKILLTANLAQQERAALERKLQELMSQTAEDTEEKGNKMVTVLQKVDSAFRNIGNNMADSFEQGLQRMMEGTATFGDFVNSVIGSIQSSIASMIAKTVTDWIAAEVTKRYHAMLTGQTVQAANAVAAASSALTLESVISWVTAGFEVLFAGISAIAQTLMSNPFTIALGVALLAAVAKGMSQLSSATSQASSQVGGGSSTSTGSTSGGSDADTRSTTAGGSTSGKVTNYKAEIISIIRSIDTNVERMMHSLARTLRPQQLETQARDINLKIDVQPGAVQLESDQNVNDAGEVLADDIVSRVIETLQEEDLGRGRA